VPLVRFLFLATLFSITFERLHWSFAGNLSLSDLLTIAFAVTFIAWWAGQRSWQAPRAVVAVAAFFALFALIYLSGFFNLQTSDGVHQWTKGLTKFVLHFVLLGFGIIYLHQQSPRFYARALQAFLLGIAANALYGVLELAFALGGHDLDQLALAPVTGGASSINIYGTVNGQNVFRPNALTGDPNHLGIMLIMPLLILTPLYLRLGVHHPLRRRVALLLAFLLLVELATLSRSGILGLAAGLVVLALPYRRRFLSRRLMAPLGGVALFVTLIVVHWWSFFDVVLRSRLSTSGGSENAHVAVYGFIGPILRSHPLLGLGLNNFSVYYAFVTGKTNWGPHSFYVALFVETGLIGTVAFAVFLWYVFTRLRHARAFGRTLSKREDPRGPELRPIAWGFTAALVGTMAANAFYLTMTFYYFYCFILLALGLPLAYARSKTPLAQPPHRPLLPAGAKRPALIADTRT
jgi:O-antigen ligase